MPEERLQQKKDHIVEVSKRAGTFLEEIRSLLPEKFSTRYKNPCWSAEQPKDYPGWQHMVLSYFHYGVRQLRPGRAWRFSRFLSKPVNDNSNGSITLCLPYFFLAGFPKSATTTIHNALGKLPQVVTPTEKEPHWWTRTLKIAKSKTFNSEYFPIAFVAYTLFFTELNSEVSKKWDNTTQFITYDGSQSTLWDSNFYYDGLDYCAMPVVISRVLPNTKFIVVMRNPITRLYSHFLYSFRYHFGSVRNWPSKVRRREEEIFHTQVTTEITGFRECLKVLSVFECTSVGMYNASKRNAEFMDAESQVGYKLMIGLYIVHIKKWLEFYPIENFLFIKMEDISKDSFGTMSKITEFLGLSPITSREVAENLLEVKMNVMRESHVKPMAAQTRSMLEEFYQPYNLELAQLLEDQHFLWNE